MMIPLLAAAAALQPAAGTPADDPDLRCMAAYLVVAGEIGASAGATAEEKSGVQAIVMYFFGKLHGRMPGHDVKGGILRLVRSPGYADDMLVPDLERCSAEAVERGEYLESFGDEVEKVAESSE